MRIAVLVSPKAGKEAVTGFKTDAAGMRELCVSVTAPPEGGKATKAVCKTVAASLGVAKSKVTCVRGDTARHKQLEIDAPEALITQWLSGFED